MNILSFIPAYNFLKNFIHWFLETASQTERQTSIGCSSYPCIHCLLPVCPLTKDRIHNPVTLLHWENAPTNWASRSGLIPGSYHFHIALSYTASFIFPEFPCLTFIHPFNLSCVCLIHLFILHSSIIHTEIKHLPWAFLMPGPGPGSGTTRTNRIPPKLLRSSVKQPFN